MNPLEIAYLASVLKVGEYDDKKYLCAFGGQPVHELAKVAAREGLLVEIMHPSGSSYTWPRYTFPSLQPTT